MLVEAVQAHLGDAMAPLDESHEPQITWRFRSDMDDVKIADEARTQGINGMPLSVHFGQGPLNRA